MTAHRGSVLFIILIVLLALGGGTYVYTQNVAKHSPTQTYGKTECHENDTYFVIEGNRAGADVGTDHLVKYKVTKNQQFECTYTVGEGDFEIKNGSAEYFLALENDFLILDSGTGPSPRGLIVYDLTKRSKVFSDMYVRVDSTNPVSVHDNEIEYWAKTSEEVTADNCPELAMHEKDGLGSVIASHTRLNLLGMTKEELGERRCVAVQ